MILNASSGKELTNKITYDHTHWKTRDPVRSPIDKPVRARLVVGSVTTSESLVLYVFLRVSFFCVSSISVQFFLSLSFVRPLRQQTCADKCWPNNFFDAKGTMCTNKLIAHVQLCTWSACEMH